MIILVRHGEATHHTLNLTGGWTDSELTPKGERQLEAVANKLAEDFVGRNIRLRILASDLKRAAKSAQIIAKALGFKGEIEYYEFLREKNNGQAAGLTEDEAKKFFRPVVDEKDLSHRNYPGGESRNEFYVRNVEGLLAHADWEKENLIIVAHKGTVQNLIFAWLGMNMQEVVDKSFSVDISPASVTILGVNKWHEHCIYRLNDISHLQKANSGFGVFDFKYGRKLDN